MPAALGPRFVLEAGFLILLAVVVGFADLRPALIILVMAIAWVLVALIEYLAWRQGPRFAAASRPGTVAEPPPVAVHEEIAEDLAPLPPPPAPPAAEEETIVEPSPVPAETAPLGEEPTEFRPEPQQRARYDLVPLEPRPPRRWIVFGPRERREAPAEGDREEER